MILPLPRDSILNHNGDNVNKNRAVFEVAARLQRVVWQ
jgi:hypothetical protein